MKNMKLILPILALSLMGLGCSKKTSVNQSPSNPQPPVVLNPDDVLPDDGSGDTGTGSNSVPLIASYADMNAYVAIRPLNDPKNIRLTVDLTKDARLKYSGTIVISYTDNGQNYQGVFNVSPSKNMYHSSLNHNDYYENHYNYWWNDAGSLVFSGFFQDAYGGLVLVIDNVSTQGNNDGVGATVLSGSIWYRNFTTGSHPTSPYRKCWFITTGPNDCRSSAVINKSSIYPADRYRKLGTFSGLSKSKAFK